MLAELLRGVNVGWIYSWTYFFFIISSLSPAFSILTSIIRFPRFLLEKFVAGYKKIFVNDS